MKKKILIALAIITILGIIVIVIKKLKSKPKSKEKKQIEEKEIEIFPQDEIVIKQEKIEDDFLLVDTKEIDEPKKIKKTKKNKKIKTLIKIIATSIICILALLFAFGLGQLSTEGVSNEIKARKLSDTNEYSIEKYNLPVDEMTQTSLNNLKEIDNLLLLINKKFEIIKSIVPEEYGQLTQLEEEITSLNLTIEESKKKITTEQDINDDIMLSLNEVNGSLTQLIEVFGTEENNIIIGKIISINNGFIEIEYNSSIFTILTSETLYDGTILKGDNAIIICDKNISKNDASCLIIIKK